MFLQSDFKAESDDGCSGPIPSIHNELLALVDQGDHQEGSPCGESQVQRRAAGEEMLKNWGLEYVEYPDYQMYNMSIIDY